MRSIIKALGGLMLLLSLALTGGCNSDSSSGSASATLTGTAATGAPMDGYVYAVDALGAEVNVAIGTSGGFSLNVTGMTGPFLLRAVPDSIAMKTMRRSGPRRLDSNWTMISAFLHHEQPALERSNETKETYPFT